MSPIDGGPLGDFSEFHPEPERIYEAELWVYAGVRALDGKRVTAWIDPGGKERLYAEKGSYALGHTYEVRVAREDDHIWRVAGSAKWTNAPVPEDITVWRLADMEAAQELERSKNERAAKKQGFTDLEEAMEPLLAIARAARTAAQREALIAAVIRRLTYPWSKS